MHSLLARGRGVDCPASGGCVVNVVESRMRRTRTRTRSLSLEGRPSVPSQVGSSTIVCRSMETTGNKVY